MIITFQDIMDFAKVNRRNYEQLKQQIQRNAVIPFVGAGLSACVYPDWRKALAIIADDIMDLSIKEEALKLLSEEYVAEHEDALEQAAKDLEDAWTKSVFDNMLYNIFSPEKLEKEEVKETLRNAAAAVLPGLFPQGIVLTTNYDHVLEEIYRTYGRGIHACDVLHQERLNRRLREMSSDSLLIKLHGDVTEAATSVILNRESYDEAYQDGSPLIEALHRCYGTKSMLFLGCSLEHDRTMDELQKTLEPGSIHFAVFPCRIDGAALQNTVRRMGEKNILPILYPEGQYICVRLILEQLLMELNQNQYRQLPVRLRECESVSESLAERLAPETRSTKFCGRDAEFGRLLDFCLERKDNFLWWAVTGDGGTGKSRIACELSVCMREKGWNVFLLKKYSDYQRFDSSGMLNGKNTLFILDRVIGYEAQIGNWMDERYHESKGTTVRVLLVERQNGNLSENRWLEQILYGTEMPGILEERCYNRQMLELQPMDEKDIKQLIISYGDICGEDQTSADEIIKQLKKIDPGKTRPLYAILLVEVWKKGELNKMDTRNKLLEYIWKAEFARYHTYFFNQNGSMNTDAKVCAITFGELKLAATILNGLEWDMLRENFAEQWESMAEKERTRKMIISNLEENREEGIAALQPDLLADYYILRESVQNKAVFEGIFAKCWEIDSIECFTRIMTVISDFPENLDFLKQVLDLPLNMDMTQQKNVYGLLLADYALLRNDLSDIQQAAQGLIGLMEKEKKNVGLKYPLAACTAKFCCGMNTFEEKWKYIEPLLKLGYARNAHGTDTIDMMMVNVIGKCLLNCYEIPLTESEFQKVEKERKKLLSGLQHSNPLYFYMLGAAFGSALMAFYLKQESIRIDLLVSLLNELLLKTDKNENVRLIYIQNYLCGLLFWLEQQTNGKKAKRIWYQIHELYRGEAVHLIEKVKKSEFFFPIVYSVWSFHDKSLELVIRNMYANNQKMMEDIIGEEAQTNAAASVKYYYTLAIEQIMSKADKESALKILEKLEEGFINAEKNGKADEAVYYSTGLRHVYNKYGRMIYNGEEQITDELMEQFRTWESELKSIENAYHSEQIHKNWMDVLTTSTFLEQDIKALRKKVGIIKAEYEAGKEKNDEDIKELRHQYSMVLNNLCKEAVDHLECREIIRLQWVLYDESGPETNEREDILWEIAKTINNTVKNADKLEECRKYSEEIQRILSFNDVHSEKAKESILLEYGKTLVNRFKCISPNMAGERKECLRELESLYLDAEQRNSVLKRQFGIRWKLGLLNAMNLCGNSAEAQVYRTKLKELDNL